MQVKRFWAGLLYSWAASGASVGCSTVYVYCRGEVGRALGRLRVVSWRLTSGVLVVVPPNPDPFHVPEVSGCPCESWVTLGSCC